MDRYDSLDLDLECEGSVAQKAALFGGMLKRSSKSVEPSAQGQDNLSVSSDLSNSNDNLSENTNSKEKGGVFKGILKKTTKQAKDGTPAQATLSVQNTELSDSRDSLTDKGPAKEKTNVLGGIFRRSPKLGHERRPSQDNLLVDKELSASMDSLSEKDSTKEKGSVFSGIFKKSPKPSGGRSQSQDDLSADVELSTSKENLAENSRAKDKGMFGGMFKKQKPLGAKAQSQEDLTAHSELSASNDSLSEKTSKGGVMGKIFKNPFHSSATDQEKAKQATDSNEKPSSSEKAKDKQAKWFISGSTEKLDKEEDPSSQKQNKFSEAMSKLNIFHSKHEKEVRSDDEDDDDDGPPASNGKSSGHKQKDTEDTEPLRDLEKQRQENLKPVKRSAIQREMKDRSETPTVPSRPAEEDKKSMMPWERREKADDGPQEPNRQATRGPVKPKKDNRGQSDDEGLDEDVSREGEKENLVETKKVKKPKRHNPFMPRAPAKAQSDDEGLEEDEAAPAGDKRNEEEGRLEKAQSDDEGLDEEESKSSKQKKEEEEEEGKDKTEEPKVRKPKKRNPFMPHIKRQPKGPKNEPNAAVGNNEATESEGGNRSLFDQLEDLRIDRTEPHDEGTEGLMEWWSTVEQWEDMPKDEDMTEKEEAKAFAITAEKVQKGIRVFNKLFSERAESLWQHVIDLRAIADGLDSFNKKTKITQITGGSTSAVGGVATIVGLALAPVTMGTSLIVTAVGLGVATAGGLTSAGAGISNQVNNSLDRKKVEKIVEDYQTKMADINKCMMFIKQGIENLRKFDLLKMKKHAYNRDFPALNNIYEDGAMLGKAILINANEIMRVVQIANVAGSTAARAVQIASMATGVLTGLFVGMDIYFVAKDSKELKKGAKSEFASKIREVAEQLHEGLVELNTIRDELQSTSSPENAGSEMAASEDTRTEKEEKPDSSEEDEIDRIKKAIKKDLENREYV